MARLDAFIEVLLSESAHALILETGSVAVLEGPGPEEARPIMKRTLTTAHIIAAVSELLPPYMSEKFRGAEFTELTYDAPKGRVDVVFEPTADGVRAVVRPAVSVQAAPPPEPAPPPETASGRKSLSKEQPGFHAVAMPRPPPAAVAPTKVETRRVIQASPPPADAAAAMQQLLQLCVEYRASDLHLTSEYAPALRVDGDVLALDGYGSPPEARLKEMLWTLAPETNKAQWTAIKDTDFAYETKAARFRVNLFADRNGIAAVLRQIPNKIISAEEMELSKQILDLCHLHKGLVLVTGPTGSGKSTTLAAMIDYVNRNRDDHIITIEDPIEFVHPHKRCLVHQREVGVHTSSFKHALRAALREDPDILLVGEMRDLETIGIALETAETGHLVFGTLHTNTAPSTVDRIIDQFPADRQPQVRTMLSESLKGVITQTLCKKVGGGRVAAQEILLGSGAVSNLIREAKTFQLPSIMQTGKAAGMQTLNDALLELVKKKLILPKEALLKSVSKSELRKALEAGEMLPENFAEA
jgi:twitching motility protein PilT